MVNLVSNAIKFTESGTIALNAEQLDGKLNITVSDTGIGIPEERLKDIFSLFVQVDGSISRERQGTGLRLSISKQLVELHEGTLTVESEPGKDSVFSFDLPIGTQQEEKPDDSEKQSIRELIVEVMHLSLDYWEQGTGKSKIELAEDSKVWNVRLERGTYITRTLDYYLKLKSLPKNPRVQNVINTAKFVLRQVSSNEEKRTILEEALKRLRKMQQTGK